MPTTLVIALVEIGFSTFAAQMVVSMAITFAVSTIASKFLSPNGNLNPNQPSDNGARQQVPPDTTTPIPVVYGSAYMGGKFVDACLRTDGKVMYYVMAISCISNSGQFSFDTTKMYYGDRLITFDETMPNRVVSLTDGAGNVDTKIDTNLYISLYTSDSAGNITPINTEGKLPWEKLAPPDESTDSVLMGIDSDLAEDQKWASTGRTMNGLAFAIVRLSYNRDAGTTQLQPITFHVTQNLFDSGTCTPGAAWYDYMTNSVYGAAVDTDFVDASSAYVLDTYSNELITFTDYEGNPQTQPRYRINGVLDTGQSILQNVDNIMTACDSWMQYNAESGKWSVVVNKPEATSFEFDDSNIIGSITVGSVDIAQTPNQVEAKFPDATNRDQWNYVYEVVPSYLLYPNEPVNKQTINYTLVNNSVQALYLANRTLEQAREDLLVTINTTYNGIQILAGDVVSITNSAYGWNNKLFRAMQVKEAINEEGMLGAQIQLIEYNAQVYDDKDITQFTPSPNSGLVSSNFFSNLTAPDVTDQQPSAAVPSFSVRCLMPTTGRVTNVSLYYTTVATPSASDWKLLSVQNAPSSIPFANGSYVKFTHISLPTNVYYFAFTVANDVGQSQLSPISTSYNWLPTPTTTSVAGTFVATFSPSVLQVPYDTAPIFTGVIAQLYGTTSGGSVDFVASQTDSDSAFVANTWRIGSSSTTGYASIIETNITVGNPSDGGSYALFPIPSAMSGNPATISVPVRYKDPDGNVSQGATAVLQYSFNYIGNSSRICYTKTTLTSLASSPTTITTSGNSSYPPNDSWGTGTVWQATAPSIVAGESVYQSDGIYSPVTDNTVWNVPYLSNLKVGELSAISANLGTITAGSITSVSIKTSPTGKRLEMSGSTNYLTAVNSSDVVYAEFGGPAGVVFADGRIGGGSLFSPVGSFYGSFNGGGSVEIPVLFASNDLGTAIEGQSRTNGIGLKGTALITGGSNHGIRGVNQANTGGTSTSGLVGVANGYDFYADGSGTNYGPFTGAHDVMVPIDQNIPIGYIVNDVKCLVKKNISNTVFEVTMSSAPNQIPLGIMVLNNGLLANQVPAAFIEKYEYIDNETITVLYPEYDEYKDQYNYCAANAVGEGQVYVCGESGDINAGDLIVTSSTPGVGMKQSDDIVRNITVAKARESITFTDTTTPQLVACIYLCG